MTTSVRAAALTEAIATLRSALTPRLHLERDSFWRATELLEDGALPPYRYVNVPPEAIPFLDSRCDGCHYGLFVDDLFVERAPVAVFVSPADGWPETVQLVARDARDFVELMAQGDLWRNGHPPALLDLHAQRAAEARRAVSRYSTCDGLGVVAPEEPRAERPDVQTLHSWLRRGEGAAIRRAIAACVMAQAPGLALAVCRDVISIDGSGFGELFAEVYRSMGRDALAEVAARTYR